MRGFVLLAVALLAAPALGALPAQAIAPPDPFETALQGAVSYLGTQTSKSGEYMVEAVIGAGIDPGLWPTPQSNILDKMPIPTVGTPGNDPIREIHAVAQSGYDPYDFQGRNLVEELKSAWTGSQQGVGQAAFTLLALHAAGVPSPDPTMQEIVALLQRTQFASGGWSCWGLPSPDCTGFALVALASENAFLPGTAERARIWLDANRLPNGGYTSGGHLGSLVVAGIDLASASEGANTQSTIWAINGYRAIGDSAPANSMAYLLSRQMPDGGFAWRDIDAKSDVWATTEIVAGWRGPFNALPTYADATITAPAELPVGVSGTYTVPGFTTTTWRDLAAPSTTITGSVVQFAFPQTGTSTLQVDAQRAGQHHREKLATTVANAAPTFTSMPTDFTVERRGTLAFSPTVSDADGHTVALAWTFDGQSGSGDISARAAHRGEYALTITATDPYGAATTVVVPVRVVK